MAMKVIFTVEEVLKVNDFFESHQGTTINQDTIKEILQWITQRKYQ